MQSDDELLCEETDCEAADHESEDDLQSDTEEVFIDESQKEQLLFPFIMRNCRENQCVVSLTLKFSKVNRFSHNLYVSNIS